MVYGGLRVPVLERPLSGFLASVSAYVRTQGGGERQSERMSVRDRARELVCDRKRENVGMYRGTSPIRKHPPPQDPPRTLGKGLRQGPRGLRFLVGEVPV